METSLQPIVVIQNKTKHALHGWPITSDPNHALLPLHCVPPMLPMPKLPNAPPLVDVPDSLEVVELPKGPLWLLGLNVERNAVDGIA